MNAHHIGRGLIALLVAVMQAAVFQADASDLEVSPPPILQWFDSTYATQERRVADLFMAGYGSVWLPPTGRADSGGQSVGYDVFDRFDLGSPGRPTLYGTEQGLRSLTGAIHRTGGSVYLDLIWNHNGFSDRDRPGFVTEGGYPGFVLTRPGAVDGDFHAKTETGDLNGRLSGLIDIRHETDWQYIRTPVDPSDPRNIPAGTRWNRPDPGNRRFYPDQALPGRTVFNPLTGQTVTLHQFNTDDPTAGDPVAENATGLLMRNTRWLVNDVGVDGFRLDAARHFEPWVLGYFDQAVFGASRRVHLDGTPYEVFSFSEAATTDKNQLLNFVRKDAGLLPANHVSGNRDALDFAQFWPIVNNLSANGLQNDFRAMVRAGLDFHDDGIINGSSGVVFVQSHDDFGPALSNVAHAFALMRPGDALVYYNAYEHYDPFRDFPKPGRGDALGNFGGSITDLVDLRNRYGRGDYRERLLEKENFAFERSGSALVMLSNRNDAGFDSRTLAVDFAPGSRLVELTGNAARVNAAAGSTVIPEVLPVSANRTVSGRFLRNDGRDQGYLVYGLATPGSSAGLELTGPGVGPVLPGDRPPVFQGGETSAQTGSILVANAKARLADLHVINGDSFTVRLATDPVTLPGGFRDRHADGDHAMLRINGGLDLNGSGTVDVVRPGDVAYGFEHFTTTRLPGFFQADGRGLYEQVIDATVLPEGMNFVTVRAFRHRDPATGGDGGPAVYTDFRKVLYVDRLPPESAFEGFRPLAGGAGNNEVWVRSLDGTADSVHVFRNVAAGVSDETLLAQAAAGIGRTDAVDRDLFKAAFFALPAGNNVVTVVTREITGRTNVQRFTGLSPANGRGAGFGDLNGDGSITVSDIAGTSFGFEQVLWSRNTIFNPAADLDGDGLVDTRDLLALQTRLALSGPAEARDALDGVMIRRVNFTGNDRIGEADLGVLRAHVGLTTGFDLWSYDLDVDGRITPADVALAQERFGVAPGVGVPEAVVWTGGDGVPGGAGLWSTAGLAWQGGVTDPSMAMPLVPGARAEFQGTDAAVTVDQQVRAVGGMAFATLGPATLSGGEIWLGGMDGLAADTPSSSTVAVADAGVAGITSVLTGTSGLVKAGLGRLVLDAVNAFTGSTLVEAGTLGLGHGGALAGSSLVEVAAGAVLEVSALVGGYDLPSTQTLSGGGTISGSVIFGAGATLAPGSSSGATAGPVTAVPEPSSAWLGALGLGLAVGWRRVARRRATGRLDTDREPSDHDVFGGAAASRAGGDNGVSRRRG